MFAQFARWFAPEPMLDQSHRLYIALVEQARQPIFYERLAVPDTLDGRFDMILLHLYLITTRLKEESSPECALAIQQLTDIFFNDMDRSLREIGVGDMSVGKKVKKMANAYNGRLTAYGAAIGSPASLTDTLRRNVYGTIESTDNGAPQLAAYVIATRSCLSDQPAVNLLSANITWPEIA